MDPSSYVGVEMVVFFGAALAFGFWQLHSVSQAKKRRIERERAQKNQDPTGNGNSRANL
jgi:hypothetical protein